MCIRPESKCSTATYYVLDRKWCIENAHKSKIPKMTKVLQSKCWIREVILTVYKDVGNVPVVRVSDVDYSPGSCSVSITPTPDSSQDLCPRCAGTCPKSGSRMTANTQRGQIKITVHHARRTLRTVQPVLRGHLIVTHPGVSICFFVPSLVPNPCTACRGCSSVSWGPGDISWYFLPTPRLSQVALQSFTFLQVWHFLI